MVGLARSFGVVTIAWGALAATACVTDEGGDGLRLFVPSPPTSAALGRVERVGRRALAGGRALTTTRIRGLQRQALRVTFEGAAVRVRAPKEAARPWQLALRTTRWGYSSALRPVGAVQRRATSGARVALRRAALTEWYKNSPAGLEHGFDIPAPPDGRRRRADDALVLELSPVGLSPELVGGAVHLRDGTGTVVARYQTLHVVDARGQAVSARLAVAAGKIQIVIDDRGARYPLHVDPVLVDESFIQVGHAAVSFGHSVAISGDTAVIGAPGDDSVDADSGAAHVFLRTASGWVEQAKLVASDAASGDNFGRAVAIEGDTIVVGAYRDDDKGQDSGSAYVFVRSGTVWTQQQKLLAAAGGVRQFFGAAVAISGATVVVGTEVQAILEGHQAPPGAAHVFVRGGTSWSEQARLRPSDSAQDDGFGRSVGVSGDSVVVSGSGAAYVFVRVGSSWSEQQKLGGSIDVLSVAIDNDTVAVASPGAGVGGECTVFGRSGSTWTQQIKLVGAGLGANGQFGTSVAVSGPRVIVGAPGDLAWAGSAYMFYRGSSGWTQDKLVASAGVAGDQLGQAVAIDGNRAIAGVPFDGTRGAAFGSAYLFARSGGNWPQDGQVFSSAKSSGGFGTSLSASKATLAVGAPATVVSGETRGVVGIYLRQTAGSWSEQQVLSAADGAAGDRFGQAVAVDGDTVVIGADGDDDRGADAGSLYVYTRVGASWTLQQKLLANDGAAGDALGSVVALSGDTLAVSAPKDDDKGQDSGSVYVFTRATGTWSLQQKIVAADGAAGDAFGAAITLDADTLVIGAPDDDDKGDASGSAYVYVRAGGAWTLQQKIVAADGSPSARFGQSLSLSGDTFATGISEPTQTSGAVYVFARASGVWSRQTKLLPEPGAGSQKMGAAVALSGDTLAVSEVRSFVPPSASAGWLKFWPPVYVRDTAQAWAQRVRLDITKGPLFLQQSGSGADFRALAASKDTVYAGFSGVYPGSVYIFELTFLADGATCSDAQSCYSGVCFQSACCHDACPDLCNRCDAAPYTCAPFGLGVDDTVGNEQCKDDKTCNGKGDCLLKNGQPCSGPNECASNKCVDGVCCESDCDKTCESCALSGSEGKCEPIAKGVDPDKECIGEDAKCGGTCDGARACDFPGIGTACGTGPCKACDGTGRCNTKPPDDDACGVIDCDQLDTVCRDYSDIDAERCAGFGKCKVENDPASCTQVTELPCGDGGAGGDGGSGADGGSSGGGSGGCSVGARADGSVLVLGLCLVVLLWRRRLRFRMERHR